MQLQLADTPAPSPSSIEDDLLPPNVLAFINELLNDPDALLSGKRVPENYAFIPGGKVSDFECFAIS